MFTMKMFDKNITEIEVGDIDMMDYPDFCDAYIESALVDGVPATESELEDMTDDSSFLYECIHNQIH
tara:strand:- start:3518 stop:3718 length:201 start_codon:yes stop_codon:yes gene_type:complete